MKQKNSNNPSQPELIDTPAIHWNLLKYQQLISCAAAKFKGLSWLTYDEQFRSRAADDLTINWGQVDLELWTVTFLGLAEPHCVICSSPYHTHSDCLSADPSRRQSRTGPVCFRFKDVRAHCYCASLVRTLFIGHARATSFSSARTESKT